MAKNKLKDKEDVVSSGMVHGWAAVVTFPLMRGLLQLVSALYHVFVSSFAWS